MEEILRVIESVDPSDTAKLDEIDARVDSYISKRPFNAYDSETGLYETIDGQEACEWAPANYTRSRDALKAIRPEGWIINVHNDYRGSRGATCKDDNSKDFKSEVLPTEELAELHAIIQAINHERKESDNERE